MIALFLNAYRLLKVIIRSWGSPNFRGGLLLAVLLLLSGTVFYKSVEGWSWVDALYFSATTVSTVGIGDPIPPDPSWKALYGYLHFRRGGCFCGALRAIRKGATFKTKSHPTGECRRTAGLGIKFIAFNTLKILEATMAAWSETQTLLPIPATPLNRRRRSSSDQAFELWSSCDLFCAKLLSLSFTENQKKRPSPPMPAIQRILARTPLLASSVCAGRPLATF